MNIIEALTYLGLSPTGGGGEYHSPCPWCGGHDRFVIWPREGAGGRYFCRGCDRRGDCIELMREKLSMSFPDAALSVGKVISDSFLTTPEERRATLNQALRQGCRYGLGEGHRPPVGGDMNHAHVFSNEALIGAACVAFSMGDSARFLAAMTILQDRVIVLCEMVRWFQEKRPGMVDAWAVSHAGDTPIGLFEKIGMDYETLEMSWAQGAAKKRGGRKKDGGANGHG